MDVVCIIPVQISANFTAFFPGRTVNAETPGEGIVGQQRLILGGCVLQELHVRFAQEGAVTLQV